MDNAGDINYRLMVVAPPGAHLRSFIELVRHASCSAIHIVSAEDPNLDFDYTYTNACLTLRKPLQYFKTIFALQQAFESFKPDIIHAHQLGSLTYYVCSALRKMNTPVVATAWGSDVLLLPMQNFLLKWLVQYTLRSANAFTADAEFLAHEMRKLLPERELDITIANYGVAPIRFERPKEKIIYSNRLHEPLYRIDKIVRAFGLFTETAEGDEWILIIAATGSETENLMKLTQALGLNQRVKFVGWLQKEENAGYYARASVFVSVPMSDATSISLLEAMNYGCFPVLSNLPVSGEWVNDGINGRIVFDIESNFFSGISKVDFKSVAAINSEIIKLKGSFEVARAKFVGLHQRILQNRKGQS